MDKKEYLALKDLSVNQLKVLAADIRTDILYCVKKNGGHLSSNLGSVEFTLSLLKNFDPLDDDILFDVGHQTYAYKILTKRNLNNLRQLGGISPFSLKEESIYDKFNNGHASTSISTAMGMVKAKHDEKNNSYTVAVIGDGSISSGLSFEALNNLNNTNNTNLIIVLNDNGMSISKNVGLLSNTFQNIRKSRFYFNTKNKLISKLSKNVISRGILTAFQFIKNNLKKLIITPNVFEVLGLKYVGPYNGHDFHELDLAFERAKSYAQRGIPCIVHLLTKKGYGYGPAMEDEVGAYHGVNKKFDETTEISFPSFSLIKATKYVELLELDKDIYIISPAMEQGSGLQDIFKNYPSRCIDVGINEEHAITFASGLALKNKKPIIDIYSTFLQRSYDQLMEDLSRENINTTVIVEKVGLSGGDGSSHHGIYDVGFIKTIPHAKIYMPYDFKSTTYIFKNKLFIDKIPLFIRLSRDTPHVLYDEYVNNDAYYSAKKNSMRNNNLIIGVGPRSVPVLNEIDFCDRILLTSLLPTDKELSFIREYDNIFFYDVYDTKSGTLSILESYLYKHKFHSKLHAFTFDNEFYEHGNVEDLLIKYELDENTIIKKIKNIFTKKDELEE